MLACYEETDWGLVKPLSASTGNACPGCVRLATPHAISSPMEYCCWPANTHVHAEGLHSVRPLSSVRQDGAAHDPRYVLNPKTDFKRGRGNCTYYFPKETLLVPRKDDHNPFFMINLLLSVWLLNTTNTQIMFLDDAGFKSTDRAFKHLITPSSSLLYADQFVGGTWCFENGVRTVPSEYSGPLMVHLNSNKFHCPKSRLINDFVDELVRSTSVAEQNKAQVTFIGRRNYNNRLINRVWSEERQAVELLQRTYTCYNFSLVYLEDYSFEQQIELAQKTRIMVGMHGAGLVFSLFMRPGHSVLVEIFPKHKRRWGYRNIARYRGIEYIQYRRGKDGPRESKSIRPGEWLRFWESQEFTSCV